MQDLKQTAPSSMANLDRKLTAAKKLGRDPFIARQNGPQSDLLAQSLKSDRSCHDVPCITNTQDDESSAVGPDLLT